MNIDERAPTVGQGWSGLTDKLVRLGRPAGTEPGFVNAPVSRGSTVLYESMDAMRARSAQRYEHELIYGAMGGPTQALLEEAIAVIEGGRHTQVVSSGLAACTTPLLAFLAAGGHCLMPDSVYGPTRRFCDSMLRRLGIETTYYDPMIGEPALEALMRPTTQVLFAESPGSHSFEVQDVRMLARVAHGHGAKLMLDNTWGIHVFQPFEHGVDVSIQALTKYPSGHADAVLGAITVVDQADWVVLRDSVVQLGQYAGPDECWLTLRGLRTMGVRLERQSRSAMTIALWLQDRPEVARVLHPALPGSPGHEFWLRDFTGAASLFGVVFRRDFTAAAVEDMVAALGVFGLGASWGGYESLVLPTTGTVSRTAVPQTLRDPSMSGPALRLHIGLESPDELIADLEGGLEVLRAASA